VNSAVHLDELRRTGEELRALFADERRAISSLDHAKLEELATAKLEIAQRLEKLRTSLDATDPLVRDLFIAIRTEARATAILAQAATQAVRSILGYTPANAYDRRARQQTSGPGRVLAAY
jgi:parvulin-like peptidyl-prolyl isomerase